MWKWLLAASTICVAMPAQAGDLDNQSHGAAVQPSAFGFPQCIRLSHDPLGWDWMLDPPCKPSDLATVEFGAHVHYRHNLTRRELQQALVVSIQTEHSSQRANPPLKRPGCIRLPEKPPEEDLVCSPPCLPGDIGQIDAKGHFTFRPDVPMRQLEYAMTVALIFYDVVLVTLKDWPEYHGNPIWPWPDPQ